MRSLVATAVLAAAILVAWMLRAPPVPPPPPPSPLPVPAAEDPASAAWWPTRPGCRWDYRVTEGTSPFRTRRYLVQGVEAGGALLFEYSDDRQTDAFTLRTGPDGALRLKEFRAAKKELLYLPAQLEPGKAWELSPDLRARATVYEDVPVPVAGKAPGAEAPSGPSPAPGSLRIEYEARYDAGQTEEPGWYPDGVRWFARGIGLVREDLRDARAPKELAALIASQRRLMVLDSFELPGR